MTGLTKQAELTEKWIIRLLKWFLVRTFLTRTVSGSVPEPNPEAQREHGGKRLGWHRDGSQPVAEPHPDPDTSFETLHGSLDVNLQETITR